MKLSEKDKQFLHQLHRLMQDHELWVERRLDSPGYLVLCGNYGQKIHGAFGQSRQGVRWRFQRVMEMYIASFETILFIEKILGSDLRRDATAISRQRYELRQRNAADDFVGADALPRDRARAR